MCTVTVNQNDLYPRHSHTITLRAQTTRDRVIVLISCWLVTKNIRGNVGKSCAEPQVVGCLSGETLNFVKIYFV